MRALRTGDPRTVGPYRVFAELGRGGMGRVLLGTGPDGRLVAVKLVHEQIAEDDGFRARFRREVEASQAVSGAYTAAVVDADPDADTPWLASVFVPGPSLHDTLAEVGALPEAAVLRLAAGLTTALTHIHRAGLVHRDLKPSNVLLAADGPRVIDFGIVRAVGDSGGEDLTRTGWLVGSPAFMSPEQAEGGSVTAASDVFALGSVIVAAVTGASPFAGAATLQTLNNVVRFDPDLSAVPPAVRRVVEPCLAKNPADRPAPEELLADIGQLAPSAQPWPENVHQLITRRQAEIAEFLEPGQDATVFLTQRAPRSTRVEPSVARTPPRVAALVVVVVLAAVVGWAVWPSGAPATDASAREPAETTVTTTVPTTEPAAPKFELVMETTGDARVGGLGFSPDGSVLAARFEDETARSWDVATRKPVGQIIGFYEGNGIGQPVFSADGATMAIVRIENDDAVVARWEVATGKPLGRPFVADLGDDRVHDQPVLSPDGRTLAVSTGSFADPRVRLWDVVAREPVSGPEIGGYVSGFSRDGRTLVVRQTVDGLDNVSIWDVTNRRQVGETIVAPRDDFLAGCWRSDDGGELVIVSSDGTVRWWDTASRNQTRQPVEFDPGQTRGFVFSPDGAHFLTRNDNYGLLMVWETATGEQVGETMDDVTAVTFAPDGALVTAHSGDDTVRRWRL